MHLLLVFLIVLIALPNPSDADTRLLRQPDISATQVVFTHGGDLWLCAREGGEARRLTSFDGEETSPHFSPDGSVVAFSGAYDGNVDVYLVAVEGGEPQRLTWHPDADLVRGWTPDGEVLFASGRINAPRAWNRLWTMGIDEVMPTALPLQRVDTGTFFAGGQELAYQMVGPWDTEWRNYRGGQTQPIRIIELETLAVEKLPWEGSNDLDPVVLGEQVFFLSDRDLAMNVWVYDRANGDLTQRSHFTEFDSKALNGADGMLVFENGGWIWTLDATGGEPTRLEIAVRGDFPHSRPHWEDVSESINGVRISPGGKRAIFEARGEIFSVPASDGDARNLSADSGAADREPSWSPDGEHVAWFSDASGEYELVLSDQFGREKKNIVLEDPTFYYTAVWSPDSNHLSFTDADRKLWVLDVESGKATVVDDEGWPHPERVIQPAWSPDSKWVAYTRKLPSQFNAVFVYSMDSGETTQFTDGMSDARDPVFDRNGKYLYFVASTNYGLGVGWLDMMSYERPLEHSVYVTVLAKGEPSPLAPRSDEESGPDEEEPEAEEEESGDVEVRIDFEGLAQRTLALEIDARRYTSLSAGAAGTIFYTSTDDPDEPARTLYRYSMEDLEETEVLGAVTDYDISADGEKLLYGQPGGGWGICDAGGTPDPEEDALDMSGLTMKVDPAAEWAQIWREAWRYQRDYFYVENVHGLDLEQVWEKYTPWLEHVRHRNDLNYLLDILGGEVSVGHSFNAGGDVPDVAEVPIGMLGFDFEVEDGRYRITRIYDAESWNPDLSAPLSGPGIDVNVGDYLISVDGRPVSAEVNLYRQFEHTSGQQIELAVSGSASGEDSRESVIVPVAGEGRLRQRAWVEDNRRRVDELSDGKLAYVWLPDTGQGGYTYFNRYYFAQMHKKGAVIDERFNHGGSIADYIVELLDRQLMGFFNNPLGNHQPWTAPDAALWGPKVMIINEMSGSGGDIMPYMFRARGIGPLVGTKTWGGLVGIWDVPDLIDGGFITSPRSGFYTLEGEWAIENEGVAPDVEVEMTPRLVADGHDPQLEEAIRIALERLETEGVEILAQPPDPVRSLRPESN